MKIMDWVKLKSSNPAKRMIAVRKLTNDDRIAKIAKEDPYPKVRETAIEMLNNEEILSNIARFDHDKTNRTFATLKLNNTNILEIILRREKERVVRLAAVTRIKDVLILANLVKQDKDLEIRKAAVKRLQHVFSPQQNLTGSEEKRKYSVMVTTLIDTIENKNCPIPIDILKFLGHIGGHQSVEILTKAMKNSSAWMRETATFALSKINDVSIIPALIMGLGDDREIIRSTVITKLTEMKWQPQKEGDKAVFLIARHAYEEAAKLGMISLPPLLKALEFEKGEKRENIVKAIGSLAPKEATEPLCKLLLLPSRQNLNLKIAAALALGKIGAQESVKPLKIAFNNNVHENVRLAIIKSLFMIRGNTAVKILNEVSTDNSVSEKVRKLAQIKYELLQSKEVEEALKG